MFARRRLRSDDCLVVAASRARCDVHEGHPGAGAGEAARAADEAREAGEREGGEGGETPVRRGASAAANATTAAESTAYLLENLARILAVERSKEIGESVDILTSAKKLFVYGVGRSGLAARAFAMRMVQLGIDCYFIGETITPVVSDGDAVLIVSNTGSTMSAIQVANIARRVGAKVISVTGQRTSKLGHASNVVLLIHADEAT
ncbi:MAG: SIS domain-containing protein, partial [Methanobacteriota archaeon]